MATARNDAAIRYLERPGGRIAYDVSGEGPLVIAAPGMGDLRSVYRFTTPALVEAGYRVAATDLRGHGESDASFDGYGDVATGTDLLALVRELGGGPAVLIGNSMSAGAAAWAAAESPELVAGLVLVGPFVRDVPVAPGMGLAFRLALMRPWGPRVWTWWYERLYPGRRPADLGTHRARIREHLSDPVKWKAFVRTSQTTHAPVEVRLGEVGTPTLVVMGEKDPDFKDTRAEADLIAERLGGTALMVPDAGHYPQAEYPEIVTPAIVDFLAGTHA